MPKFPVKALEDIKSAASDQVNEREIRYGKDRKE